MSSPFTPPLTEYELREYFPSLSEIQIIKSGGEGTVFKAINHSINKPVAVKIYSQDHLLERNQLEVSKLSSINCPYLIDLYNYGEISIRNSSCFFTETRFIDGQDLRTLLNNKYEFNIADVKKLLECISLAIESLWKEKVVHCDIKPDNILKHGDQYILIDLGIAKYIDEPTMTEYGMIMGTRGYIAPEQINGRKNLTYKTDYYSLGIVAYEVLAKYHPFNFNQHSIMKKLNVPEFPSDIKLPDSMKNIIYSLTNPVPYKRPLNRQDILNCIEEV